MKKEIIKDTSENKELKKQLEETKNSLHVEKMCDYHCNQCPDYYKCKDLKELYRKGQ